jgi:hypothetical protein
LQDLQEMQETPHPTPAAPQHATPWVERGVPTALGATHGALPRPAEMAAGTPTHRASRAALQHATPWVERGVPTALGATHGALPDSVAMAEAPRPATPIALLAPRREMW